MTAPTSASNIWIVEDDPSTQRLLSFHLKQAGFEPVVFDSAEKALAELNSGRLPALMILDMLLPGMSGVDLIRLIKQNDSWSTVPVVVVTVLSRDDAPGGVDEASTAFWVNKPFDTDHLIKTIQKILAAPRS
jgi:DNA-binding response OmpR family regulator